MDDQPDPFSCLLGQVALQLEEILLVSKSGYISQDTFPEFNSVAHHRQISSNSCRKSHNLLLNGSFLYDYSRVLHRVKLMPHIHDLFQRLPNRAFNSHFPCWLPPKPWPLFFDDYWRPPLVHQCIDLELRQVDLVFQPAY